VYRYAPTSNVGRPWLAARTIVTANVRSSDMPAP
jgi:hypothetical protein